MNANESDKTTIKPKNRNRNEENRRQIIDFIADNGFSDSKTVSKAIGLKPSRTRDYLKQLVEEDILEVEGEYKSRKYRIKKRMVGMVANSDSKTVSKAIGADSHLQRHIGQTEWVCKTCIGLRRGLFGRTVFGQKDG